MIGKTNDHKHAELTWTTVRSKFVETKLRVKLLFAVVTFDCKQPKALFQSNIVVKFHHCTCVVETKPLSWHFSPPVSTQGSEGTVINGRSKCEHFDAAALPAQRKTHQLIIEAIEFNFVTVQRLDAYYRKDPKKYGLICEREKI